MPFMLVFSIISLANISAERMKSKGMRGNPGYSTFDSGKISFQAIVHEATFYIVVYTFYPLHKVWSETEVVKSF